MLFRRIRQRIFPSHMNEISAESASRKVLWKANFIHERNTISLFFIVYSYFIVKYFLTGRDRKEEKTWEREPLIIPEHIPALIYRYLSWRCRYFFPILFTVLLFDLSESRHRPTSYFRHMNFRDRDLDVEVRKYAVVGPGAVLRRATIGSLVHKGSTSIS